MGSGPPTSATGPSICRPLLSTMTQRFESAWWPANIAASPNLALFDFPVAQQSVNPVVFFVQFSRQRHAYSSGNPLPQRAGTHVHTWGAFHVRMALQHCSDMAELLKLALSKIAALRQSRIEPWGTVAPLESTKRSLSVFSGS